ncbi:zinc finger protein 354A-like isoform X11 [Diprion similis]|uniref:zinc finger protein 354A-like isoform X11 n=1 Tax=Diprion similis TaxID=362088 RepID=UPI001EF7D411|nr:zinc finger protein 354A-like isoform X11 [Diprion similis]
MSSLDYLDLCRLCLMKDRVSVPIFEGEGDVRQIFLKIAACLPVKVAREDKLPKKICDDCVYKVELLYQFWNTTANAEKQLLQWLGEVGLEDKQGYVTGVLNPSTMKQEENNSSGLGGAAIQVTGVQPGIGIGVIDNMGLGMPLIIPSSTQQQLTAVPMDTSTGPIQPIQPIQQAVPGPSSQPGHEQITQSQTNATTHQQDEEEDTSEDEENSDDDCDGDDGLPVKEESEEDPNNSRTIEPTTFVNVSLACDEAGPSGLQQQKIVEIPEMAMPQTTDGDPKSGSRKHKENNPEEYAATQLVQCELNDGSKARNEPSILKKEPCSLDKSIANESDNFNSEKHVPENVSCPELDVRNSGRFLVFVDSIPDEYDPPEPVIKIHDVDPLKAKKRPRKRTAPVREWKCNKCDRICTTKELLRKHRVVHSEEYKYSCDLCDKKFKRSNELKVHRNTHSNEKHFTCNICPTAFKMKAQLTIHKKRHTTEYEFTCEHCLKGFYTKGDYKYHKFAKHGESTHVCSTCNKPFRSKNALKKHLKVHEPDYIPEKPNQCEICGKMYATQKSLKIHVGKHTGEKSYSCDTCGKKVRSRASLRDHLRLHTGQKPVICCYCNKGFTKRSTMTVHMRTHTGERPYKCDICPKTFTQRTSLVIHQRYHSGARPYQCATCSKGFVSGAQLKLHQNSCC